MKKAIIALSLIFCSLTVSAETIIVTGQGSNREAAKQDAFRIAIEKVCGVAVLSNREFQNREVIRNAFITYSGCRIDDYEIILDQGTSIKLKAYVTKNGISHRLFNNSSNTVKFDTENVQAQAQTILEEQTSGDKLIDEVFTDYPYKAFNLNSTQEPYFVSDSNRQIFLMIPFDIRWNHNFVTDINGIFDLLQTKTGRNFVMVSYKNPNNFIGRKTEYRMGDDVRFNHIKSKFVGDNELRLKIKAKDINDNMLLDLCYNPEYVPFGIFYSVGVSNQLTIFGNDRNTGTIRINLNIAPEKIYDLNIDVVANRDCK